MYHLQTSTTMIPRLDELSDSVVLKRHSTCDIRFKQLMEILKPSALDFIYEKRRCLWQDVANVTIFCGGVVFGPSWNQLIDGYTPDHMSCCLSEEIFNHYFFVKNDISWLVDGLWSRTMQDLS